MQKCGHLIIGKISKNRHNQISDFKAKMNQVRFRSDQRELTAFPQIFSCVYMRTQSLVAVIWWRMDGYNRRLTTTAIWRCMCQCIISV